MNDDWLKEFDLDEENNILETLSDSSGKPIALDSLGIPILEEVVLLEDDCVFDENISFEAITESSVEIPEAPEVSPESSASNLSLLSNATDSEALKDQLRSKLKHDLEGIAGSLANAVVSNISSELEQQIKSQLTQLLEQRLDEMINSAIADISKGENSD